MVKALSRVVWLPQFDAERFKQKAEAHKYMLSKQGSLQAYLHMIEDVYNRQARKSQKENLAFLAQEAASARRIANVSAGKK
jgi:hypothetical protein